MTTSDATWSQISSGSHSRHIPCGANIDESSKRSKKAHMPFVLKTGIRATHTAMNLRPAHNPYKWTRYLTARCAIGALGRSNPVLEDHQAAERRHRSTYERGRYRQ